MLMDNSFSVRLADRVIKVTPQSPYLEEYCKDYLCHDRPDFAIALEKEDIRFEREKAERAAFQENQETQKFSDGYLETLALYRKIAEKMLLYDTLLVHGSCVAVDGSGFLFTAVSGTGKSTHTRLWREYFGGRAVMVNDDKPLITVSEQGIRVYGTPWNGKHHLGENISVPLKAICVLKRGTENRIEPISRSAAYPILLQQTYRPQDAGKLSALLALLDKLGQQTSLYQLYCNMEPDAAEVAYQGMMGVR